MAVIAGDSLESVKMESETPTKASVVSSLMAVKRNSGKTFTQIAAETGLTNVYVAQLLRRQAQLKPDTAPKLRAALPDLTEIHIRQMMEPPLRSYDPAIVQDPTVYRLYNLTSICFCLSKSLLLLNFMFNFAAS